MFGGKNRLNILNGILPVQLANLRYDIFAGITLAAVAIPIDMGYTKIAGMPIVSGLYILLFPAIAFALFGFSKHLVVGADSASAAIMMAALVPLAAIGSSEYGMYAALLAIMVGILLLVCRLFRLGFLANFLSRTVLTGFLTGVGIQVALGQLGDFFGIPGISGTTIEKVMQLCTSFNEINYYALGFAVCTFVILFIPKLFGKKIPLLSKLPWGLFIIIGSITLMMVLGLSGMLDSIGLVQSGLPQLVLPSLDSTAISALIGPAIAIVVVIITQSAATSEVYALRHNEETDTNNDIFGLSIANIIAGFTGAFVTNGSPMKTEVADRAGSRSQITNITAAIVVIIVLLFLTEPLQFLPTAVLAAIVLQASLGLIDFKSLKKYYIMKKSEFFVAVITVITVVVFGAAQGIVLAMLLSLIAHIKRSYHPQNRILVLNSAKAAWTDVAQQEKSTKGIVVYRFAASLYYANANFFAAEIRAIINRDDSIKELVFDFSAISDVDYTGGLVIGDTIRY